MRCLCHKESAHLVGFGNGFLKCLLCTAVAATAFAVPVGVMLHTVLQQTVTLRAVLVCQSQTVVAAAHVPHHLASILHTVKVTFTRASTGVGVCKQPV
jgi:hypothetical protein